jgi:FKBP-type peptidyl-prolyl cis-trans isomerase
MIVASVALAGVLAAGCASSHKAGVQDKPVANTTAVAPAPTPVPVSVPAPTQEAKVHTLPSGLVYEDLVVGEGRVAEAGQSATVHYTGWLTDGTKFDSSLDRGDPFQFALGAGQVIRGWDEGVQGMRIGGKRKLTIPSDLGYGSRGAGGVIPPNATLVFEVELLGLQ